MNHEMMVGPSGNFLGHFAPGLIFIALGLWWLAELIFRGPRKPGELLERTIQVPLLKFVVLVIAGYIEMPNSGWFPMDWVMGWHHITVYLAFALSGVVDGSFGS